MKFRIFTTLALAASLMACEMVEAPVQVAAPSSDEGISLEITASIGDPATRVGYTENTDGSYSAGFVETDVLWVSFLNAENQVITSAAPVRMNVLAGTISFDKKKAKFNTASIDIPSDAATLVAYLSSTSAATAFATAPTVLDLSNQTNLNYALNNQLVVGTVKVSDIKAKESGEYTASIPFATKTSLLKFDITLPNRSTLASDAVVCLSGSKVHNIVSLNGAEPGAQSTIGDVKAKVYNVVIDTNTVTTLSAAACVWGADDLSDAKVLVYSGDDVYSANLKPTAAIAAGKVYTVKRTLVKLLRINQFIKDAAGSMDFEGGDEVVSKDFLSYSNGKVSWTANETGKPRTAELVTSNGSSIKLTQLEAKDFHGNWTLTSKVFSNDASFIGAGNAKVLNVVFGEPKNTTEITDGHGEKHTANVGITGFYKAGFVVDAVVDIDYEKNDVRFALLLDGMKAQNVGGKYFSFLPGICATWSAPSFSSPWIFVCPDFGLSRDNDYEWVWFDLNDDWTQFTYSSGINAQRLANETAYSSSGKYMPFIIGFCVVGSSAEDVTAATAAKSYTLVYQFNDDASNDGSYFTRK